MAAAVVFVLIVVGVPLARLLPAASLPWLAGWWLVLLGSNLVFRRLIDRPGDPERRLLWLILADMVILTGLLNASGGIENPLYVAYLFPVVIAAMLLSRRSAFLVALAACLLFFLLVIGEASHRLPHVTFGLFPHSEAHPTRTGHASHDPRFVAGKSLSLVVLVVVAHYLTSRLRDRLRKSERTIENVAREAILEHERLAGTIQAAGVGMMVVNPDLTLTWLSRRAAQWLAVPEGAWGRPCPLYESTEGCTVCVVLRSLREGRAVEVERRIEADGGGSRYLRHAAEPVRDEEGQVIQVVELLEDVTHRKALEAEALHAGKLAVLGQLAAGLAHEIGNPLASLTTRLTRLEHERDPAFLDASLELLRTHLRRIERTVRNVSLFSRHRATARGVFGVDSLVQEAVDLIHLDPRVGGVQIERVSSQDGLYVEGDQDQLLQVLINLLLNAVESMAADGGSVSIATNATPEAAEISVVDSGDGVPPENRRRIFEPFFTTKRKGVGLGLALSRSLVEAHGGELDVRPTPGGGATFVVSLPIRLPEDRCARGS